MAMCRSADHVGPSTRPRAGGMDEFYGVREYRPGDNPRHIYWRRSARTGVMVSKDMTRVSPPRLMLLVDTCAAGLLPERLGLIERAIAMAASLASAALQEQMAVGLIAWMHRPIVLPPTHGKQQRKELLTLLARLPANRTFQGHRLLDEGQWLLKSGTTLVMFTPRESDPIFPQNGRGGLVTLSAASESTASLFRFAAEVRFDGPVAHLDENLRGSVEGKKRSSDPARTHC